MKIIEPSTTMLAPSGFPYDRIDGENALRFIEAQARISHKSEEAQTGDSWKRFIEAVVLKHGDWSVCEHAHVTVKFQINRGLTHELVRHRLFSFSQESTRFVNYGKEGTIAEYIPSFEVREPDQEEWKQDLLEIDAIYLKWLKRGYSPQIARDFLPNALAADISVTGNLRSWRWFFQARTTKETHPDMRRVVIPLLEEFKSKIPLLYDDLQPLEKQSISMAKVH